MDDIQMKELRILVDLRDRAVQKGRIAMGNRMSAVQRGSDQSDIESYGKIKSWSQRFDKMEKELDADIRELAKDVEIIQSLSQVKGIGFILAAKLVALIDIERADTVSALWRYAGYSVTPEGKREKNVKGEKSHFNRRLKTTCWLIASSFLKCRSPYREIYDSSREYYDEHRPDWTKAHKHNAAMGRMIKIMLQHLWVEWRKMEGMPVGEPYVIDRLGHSHYRKPQEFGWPTL